MNKYEFMYILENNLDEASREAMIAKFNDIVTSKGGSIESVDKWGTKRLATPINFKTEGYYVLVNFTADSTVPAELERVMKITDSALRCMIVRK